MAGLSSFADLFGSHVLPPSTTPRDEAAAVHTAAAFDGVDGQGVFDLVFVHFGSSDCQSCEERAPHDADYYADKRTLFPNVTFAVVYLGHEREYESFLRYAAQRQRSGQFAVHFERTTSQLNTLCAGYDKLPTHIPRIAVFAGKHKGQILVLDLDYRIDEWQEYDIFDALWETSLPNGHPNFVVPGNDFKRWRERGSIGIGDDGIWCAWGALRQNPVRYAQMLEGAVAADVAQPLIVDHEDWPKPIPRLLGSYKELMAGFAADATALVKAAQQTATSALRTATALDKSKAWGLQNRHYGSLSLACLLRGAALFAEINMRKDALKRLPSVFALAENKREGLYTRLRETFDEVAFDVDFEATELVCVGLLNGYNIVEAMVLHSPTCRKELLDPKWSHIGFMVLADRARHAHVAVIILAKGLNAKVSVLEKTLRERVVWPSVDAGENSFLLKDYVISEAILERVFQQGPPRHDRRVRMEQGLGLKERLGLARAGALENRGSRRRSVSSRGPRASIQADPAKTRSPSPNQP